MLTEDYTVRLEQFQGPLDLLLYLVRKTEVDIVNIPIARIADQYIDHLGEIGTIDIDLAGEFLVMAATLIELKSRLIMPSASPATDDDDRASLSDDAGDDLRSGAHGPTDLRSELIRQLLAYKEFRDAADALEHRRESWVRRFAAGRAATDREAMLKAVQRRNEFVELEDIGLFDLVEAYERVVVRVNFDLLGAHRVALDDDDTPIEVHAEELVELLTNAGKPMSMQTVLAGRTRGQTVGLFVAALELVRRRRLSVDQHEESGEFMLALRSGDEEPDGGIDDSRHN